MSQNLLLYATFEVKFNVFHQKPRRHWSKNIRKAFSKNYLYRFKSFFLFFIRAYLSSYYTKVKHSMFYSTPSEDSKIPFISIFGEDYPAQGPEWGGELFWRTVVFSIHHKTGIQDGSSTCQDNPPRGRQFTLMVTQPGCQHSLRGSFSSPFCFLSFTFCSLCFLLISP